MMAVSDGVAAFVGEVREYCQFISRAGAMSLGERQAEARERLLNSYTAALALPQSLEPGDMDAGKNPDRPVDWQGFGDDELYWEVFDPYEQSEPVCGSLSDDLLEV